MKHRESALRMIHLIIIKIRFHFETEQKQSVYKINAKFTEEIDKLETKVKELKDKRDKERLGVLTADQKKRLEEILKKKSGGS